MKVLRCGHDGSPGGEIGETRLSSEYLQRNAVNVNTRFEGKRRHRRYFVTHATKRVNISSWRSSPRVVCASVLAELVAGLVFEIEKLGCAVSQSTVLTQRWCHPE